MTTDPAERPDEEFESDQSSPQREPIGCADCGEAIPVEA